MAGLKKQGRWVPVDIPEISELSTRLRDFISNVDAMASVYELKYYGFYDHYVDGFNDMVQEIIDGILGSYGLERGDVCYDAFVSECIIVVEMGMGREFPVRFPKRAYIREDLAGEVKG